MTGVKAPKIPPPKSDPEARMRRAGAALRSAPPKPVRPKPARVMRLRLVDAVALAAAGLLVLKLLSLIQVGLPEGGTLPDYGRAVAQARTGFDIPDPVTTGSVGGKEEKAAAEKPAEKPPEAPPATQGPASPTERVLLEKLGARRDALRQKNDELDLREKMLGEAERKLETGLGDLKKAEDKVEAGAKAKEEAEKQGLKNIVTMYEAMKPKDAARVFDRLGHDVLVPIVLAMNPRKMAEVLAVMQPETAERLTVALANRARGTGGAQAQAGAGLPAGELPAIDPGVPGR